MEIINPRFILMLILHSLFILQNNVVCATTTTTTTTTLRDNAEEKMLPSSGRSIGEQSTTVLPSNRSIILADSRFRTENRLDSPYDFKCDLSGTAIYAKEFYYQKLYWNQPLYSHNNANCELRFQMNGDTTTTYVVYACPFIMHHQYDGNPPGTSLLTPQTYSYANDLELALNGDIRTIPLNTTLINGGSGKLVDPNNPLNYITMRFRYSPTRGFCIYPLQDSATPGYYFTIRLMPCSYIAKAHFVHGFGFYDPDTPTIEYVPHDFFSVAIWSDGTPNLLPSRYIVVQSQELNKDRRLISFHNGNFANFVNELGIFSINPSRTGVFHEVGVGDDATVVSLRDEYTPQSFRIQILDERGNVIKCDDIINNVLQSSGIDPAYTYSYFDGPYRGRGSPDFINYLVFGYRLFRGSPAGLFMTAVMNSAVANPFGMWGMYIDAQPMLPTANFAQLVNLGLCMPLILDGTPFTNGTPYPIPQGVGFAPVSNITSSSFFSPFNVFTVFTWYHDINPFPRVQWDVGFGTCTTFTPGNGDSAIVICMFDALTNQVIQIARKDTQSTTGIPPVGPFVYFGSYAQNWQVNPDYVFPASPSTINVGFAIAWISDATSGYSGVLTPAYSAAVPPPAPFGIANPNSPLPLNPQTEYVEPDTDYSYTFGDPLAGAMCEEVIHEIAAVLEYN